MPMSFEDYMNQFAAESPDSAAAIRDMLRMKTGIHHVSADSGAKARAIEQFVRRYERSMEVGVVDNQSLYAGQPVFIHCEHCGVLVEKLPEDYLFPPRRTCSQCAGLTTKPDWLAEAKRSVSGVWPRLEYNQQTQQLERV